MIRKYIPLLMLSALLPCGCAVQYQSHIRMPDGTDIALPKDSKGDVLVLEREYTDAIGRTNRIHFYMTNWSFKMNPAVIDARTAHDVAIIGAATQGAGTLIGAGAKAAAGVP